MKINFIPALPVFLFSGAMLLAAGTTAAKIDIPLIDNEKTQQKELAVAKLNDIIRNIKLQKMEAEAKSRLLMKAKTEQEKNKIQTTCSVRATIKY
ncbi:MAG: hypothetical protein JSR71_04295 [Proteobacteria bacterium]|nr:hypothetical protein [Pseudomonadota bacterium]